MVQRDVQERQGHASPQSRSGLGQPAVRRVCPITEHVVPAPSAFLTFEPSGALVGAALCTGGRPSPPASAICHKHLLFVVTTKSVSRLGQTPARGHDPPTPIHENQHLLLGGHGLRHSPLTA